MRIVAARVAPVRLALRRPLVTARGAIADRHGFVLHLAGGGVMDARGEASPAYWLGEVALADTAAALHAVVARCRAQPSLAEARGWLADAYMALPAAAACALDAALLDLEAQARGTAVAALLAGAAAVGQRARGIATAVSSGDADATPTPPRSAPGRGSLAPGAAPLGSALRVAPIPVAALVAGRTPAAAAAAAEAALAEGFRTLKLKVGGMALADDTARVAAVRERMTAYASGHHGGSVGPRSADTPVALRLDANRAWTRAEAERALAALARFDPEYVEEPLAEGGVTALATLAAASPLPLAADESLRDADDLARLVDAGARVHVVLKAARVGGPTPLVALARRAIAAGLPVTVTDAIESGVGMAHAVHAAAALGTLAPVRAVGLGGAQLAPSEAALRRSALVARGPGIAVASALGDGNEDEGDHTGRIAHRTSGGATRA